MREGKVMRFIPDSTRGRGGLCKTVVAISSSIRLQCVVARLTSPRVSNFSRILDPALRRSASLGHVMPSTTPTRVGLWATGGKISSFRVRRNYKAVFFAEIEVERVP